MGKQPSVDEIFRDVYKINLSAVEEVPVFLSEITGDSRVVWAEPNYRYPVHLVPNDTLYSHQWSLSWLNMEAAWEIQQGHPDIVVGVIDTGIDHQHPDLRGQIWINQAEDLNGNGNLDSLDLNGIDDDGNGYIDDVIGWDFTDAPNFPDQGDYQDPDNDPGDEYPSGHGTPVAGIISARLNNLTGIAGIAPGIRVMNLRAGTASGYLEEDDVAEAILYAVNNGARIINMSFGDVAFSYLLKEAVDFGYSRGVLFVASAGNSGTSSLQFPAGYDQTISVGASDIQGQLTSFSSFGSKQDLVAPGQNILAPNTYDGFSEFSGTSFAAPMICGVLALIWSPNPSASPAQVKSQLFMGCQDHGAAGWDHFYGHGITNAFTSLTQKQTTIAWIESPETYSGIKDDRIPIIGSATATQFKEFVISYGVGINPLKLIPLYSGRQQVVEDTLFWWNTAGLSDSVYTLELKTCNWDLSAITQRVVVFLDRTAPVLEEMEMIPLLVEDYYGFLILIQSDDPSIVTLHYRSENEIGFSHHLISNYFSTHHSLLLTQVESRKEVEFYLEIQNGAGQITRADNHGQYYRVNLDIPVNFREEYRLVYQTSGSGYFMDKSVDFNQDGYIDVVGNLDFESAPVPRFGALNYRDSLLTGMFAQISAFGRDTADVDGDGIMDLLAGYGGTSYIFNGRDLPQFSGTPLACPETDFWAARIFDLNHDQQWEILALHQNQWRIYRLENPSIFSVTLWQTLVNSSPGENAYSVPYAEIGDANNNGETDFLIGDYDGDLILYEASANGAFEPETVISLPGVDATHRFATGDFDLDGQVEIAIATQIKADNGGEYTVDRNYWNLNILKISPDGLVTQIWQQNFHHIVDHRETYSGLTVYDYDLDGKDEIFFTPYPRAYYIQHVNGEYQVNWYLNGVNSNSIPPISANHALVNGIDRLMVWEKETVIQRPLPPAGFRVASGDTLHFQLVWLPVPAADAYRLVRHDLDEPSMMQFVVTEPGYRDTLVTPNHMYTYTVQTVDSTYPVPVSSNSITLRVKAEAAPGFVTWELGAPGQILLQFDRNLGEGSFQVERFRLLPDTLRPTSVIRGRGSAEILLGFPHTFSAGEHEIEIFHLENALGVPFYKDTVRIAFHVPYSQKRPYLSKIDFISRRELLLSFSQPMEQTSVENTGNYSLDPEDLILRAETDPSDQRRVHLFLQGRNRMGSLGEEYYLEIGAVKDIWGNELAREYGTRFLIRQAVDNLEQVVVFPNPLKPDIRQNKIMFGNLPYSCEIYIFTPNGELVNRLENRGFTGGIEWDLLNSKNETVGNGVYLFIAKYQDVQKSGKFVILR